MVTNSNADSTWHFYHAWLADCINDFAYEHPDSARKDLAERANASINGVLTDTSISNAFGQEELVWGPVFDISAELGIFGKSDYYTSKNFMYCFKSTTRNKRVTYSVGISGTNEISPYDWLTEDINVDSMNAWDGGASKISNGSYIGFTTLNLFRDSTTKNTLKEFLEQELRSNHGATIAIAGHSLGGALTQVMASYLGQSSSLKNDSAIIQAWVYAGPTAGDSSFASTLAQQVDYHAYSNKYDCIPHAWQEDSLKELCHIYDNFSICDTPVVSTVALKGVLQFLQDFSSAGDYTVAGTPVIFNGTPMALDDSACQVLYNDTDDFWTWASGYVVEYLNTIKKRCNDTNPVSKKEFFRFAYYFAELGYQHTDAYVDYFFKDETSNFKQAITQYIPGNSGLGNDDEARLILQAFLKEVGTYLSTRPIGDCGCS